MGLFKPAMYKKNIFEINYKKLKEKGITCLVFDLDNTLGLIDHRRCPEETRKLIKKLQDDFLILISSNNTRGRITPYLEELGVGGVSWSMKPSTRGLRKIKSNFFPIFFFFLEVFCLFLCNLYIRKRLCI